MTHRFVRSRRSAPNAAGYAGTPTAQAIALLGLSLILAVPARASDDTAGRLRLVQVIREGVDGVAGLLGARAAAVSPDRAHVYVASEFGDALAAFSRDPVNGRLTFIESRHNGTGGVDGLGDAREVVISPDGEHVYVASAGDSALVAFARDGETGRLTFVQAQRDGMPGVGPDHGPVGLAISPDGAHVYAAGVGENDVAVFARDGATGMLTATDVVPLGVPASTAFSRWNPGGVRVSPDGANVYVVGRNDSALTAFARNPATGTLSAIGSWRDGAGGVQGLASAFSLALSPDGANVYVASAPSAAGSALAVFGRDASTGKLRFLQVVRERTDRVPGLAGARAVVVSPDGAHVYATGVNGKAVVLFARDPATGRLTVIEALRSVLAEWIGMGEVFGFALSPDGAHLYLPSRSHNAVLGFTTDEGGMAPIVRCVGDCDLSSEVTVDEVVTGVDIALGSLSTATCETFDGDGDRAVTVDELIAAVRNALIGCDGPLTPGDHRRSLAFGGQSRIYDLHVPSGYDGQRPLPLVVDVHGLNGNPTLMTGYSGFRALADAEGFVVAYPLGSFGRRDAPEAETGLAPSFNAGFCCGSASFAQVDDVGFIRAMIEAIAAQVAVDRTRVYGTGLSNGGAMSQRLACEAADIFAAAAPVAGRITLSPLSGCQPSRPIAVIEFAGLNDPQNPYAGTDLLPSAAASLAFWRDINGCGSGAPDERVELGTSFCEIYRQCTAGVQVELCSVNASQASYVPGHFLYSNPDIDIARTAWAFLSRFRLPEP